eukprot:m.84073 g.84073  ORF g.84073 m.84073 type:complete len:62 (+) comp12736_c0_seq6:848-1033(+)
MPGYGVLPNVAISHKHTPNALKKTRSKRNKAIDNPVRAMLHMDNQVLKLEQAFTTYVPQHP